MKNKSKTYLLASIIISFGLFYALFAALSTFSEASDDGLNEPVQSDDIESLRWYDFADLPLGRGDPGVVTYDDKLFAISGFYSPGEGYVDNVGIYHPISDTWEVRWGIPNPRSDLMAAVVGDQIYAIGGWIVGAGAQGATHKYDPQLNTWLTMTSMITAVSGAGVTVYNDDIYIIGGYDGEEELASVQIYDPAGDSWSLGTPMNSGRSELGAVLLDDKFYAVGGNLDAGGTTTTTNTVEIYDPILDEWSAGNPLPEPVTSFAVAVWDGKIFAIGGTDIWGGGTAKNSTYVFDPTLNSWVEGAPMPTARSANEAAVIGDRIYVIGGTGSFTAGLANEAYGDFPIVYIPLTLN